MELDALKEIIAIMGPAGASVVVVVYLFRTMPPQPRKQERDAYEALGRIEKRLEKIEEGIETGSKEQAKIDKRLAVVETTQKFIQRGLVEK